MTLPAGFAVDLRPDTRRYRGGRLLLGGSPIRALRISAAAAESLATGRLVVADDRSERLAAHLLAADIAVPVPSLARATGAGLTVVIPVKDRPDALARTLVALGSSLKIIVVDDGSTDPARIESLCQRHHVEYIRLPVNRGPAHARNEGLAQVTSPFVAFVDSDVQVTASDLQALVGHFADDRVALIAPRVRGWTAGARPRWFERYDRAASSLDLGGRPSLVRPHSAVSYLPAACLVARRSALGVGFDQSMRTGEDVDLVWRLVCEGHSVRYDPAVVARHEIRATASAWLQRKVVYGSSAADLAARHGEAVAPAVLTPSSAVAAALLLGSRRPALAVALGGVVALRHACQLRKQLPGSGASPLRLGVVSVLSGVRQEASLVVRHWWPISAMVALRSQRARRVIAAAIVVDTFSAIYDRPELDLIGATVGRHADDLAYGLGLWLGCIRARSAKALVPVLIRRRSAAPTTPSRRSTRIEDQWPLVSRSAAQATISLRSHN